MDKYFENVCELDIMFNLEKAHIVLDELVSNGLIVDANKVNVLQVLAQTERLAASQGPAEGILGTIWGR